jgi:hypothetical protein
MDSKLQTVMRKILIFLLVLNYCLPVMGQVNLQTGSAVMNVPLFNWQDNKSRLNLGVSLDYNSGAGLRVNEVASNIGQGWNLTAGGVITRMQVGEPDDQKPRDGAFDDINKYPAGYLYSDQDPAQGCPTELIYYPIFGEANKVYKQHNALVVDRELDYFSFQFNGRSGIFVLGKNNQDKGIVLGDSKIQIRFERNETQAAAEHSRTTITAFYILDENGLEYKFNQLAKTKVLKMKTNTSRFYNRGTYFEDPVEEIPLESNPYIISNWCLTQIRDLLTGRTIDFTYKPRDINSRAGDDLRWVLAANPDEDEYFIVTHKRSVTVTPVVNTIRYPDGHLVTLNYDETKSRFDLKGDYPMKSVDITYNGRAVSSYRLNTSYFILNKIGIPVSAAEASYARLCLTSITKVGVDLKDDLPLYQFDYYTGSGVSGDFVPPPFYYFSDIWGYYNGGKINEWLSAQEQIPFTASNMDHMSYAQKMALCYIRNEEEVTFNTTKEGYARNGLLKTVTNVMGGQTSYTYEQNKYGENSFRGEYLPYAGGVHVYTVSKTDGGSSFNGLNTEVTTYKFTKEDGTSTSLWGVEPPFNLVGYAYSYKPGGAHSKIFSGCKYDYTFPGILSREEAQNIPSVSNGMQTLNTIITVASLVYDIITFITTGNPVFLIYDVINIIVNWITACNNGYWAAGTPANFFNYNAFGKNSYLNQFSRVEVFNGDPSNNVGKTVYEFTNKTDYRLWDNGYPNPVDEIYDQPYNPWSMKQRQAFWAYGLPKKITVYDSQGKKIKQTENEYYWDDVKRQASPDVSCNCLVKQYVQQNSPDWMNLSDKQNFHYTTSSWTYTHPLDPNYVAWRLKVHLYNVYTGRIQLKDSYERNFKQGDDSRYVETVTHYDYNPNNYQVSKTTTTHSNGDQVINEIYYPGDYNAGVLQSMANKNIINLPVATYSAIRKNGSSAVAYVGASVTDFTNVGSGDIKPSKNFSGRSLAPETNFSFNAGSPFNYPGLVETGSYTYDGFGKLIGMRDEGGRVLTNIYDYNDKYIVASVINADPAVDRVAYTSFETPTWNGGWSLIGNANYVNTAVTGVNGFALTGNSLTATITQGKPYRLTYWANGAVTINGAGAKLITTGPINNGYTYYEYELAATTSSLSISGNANIDELRLYPQMARMRTVTYDPLIGKTTESDENNRITYYEYDNMGRLRFIKDENRNILRMYEYNFKK